MFKLIETGAKDIDAQHMQLINCMNELHQALSAPSPNRGIFKASLKKLHYYALSHFAYEEQGMSVFGYPDASVHLEQHLYFKSRLSEIETKADAESHFTATELLLFLRKWLLEHIAKSDVQYAEFLREREKTAS